MERPPVHSFNGQWSNIPKHDVLARNATGNALHADAADTDLCLSMVHETRPSYQMKTAGKTPLTPTHLTSLILNNTDNDKRSNDNNYYSSSSHQQPSFHTYQPPSNFSPNKFPASFTQQYDVNGNTNYSPSISSNIAKTPYGQSYYESSAYKLNQKLARETPPLPPPPPPAPSSLSPPLPPPPPPLSQIRSEINYLKNHSPTANYSPSKSACRTFNDYDPDDILKELKIFPSSSAGISPAQKCAISPGGQQRSVVSPNARGLAPPPTDQPVTCPATQGVEANVDAMTIRMMQNMNVGGTKERTMSPMASVLNCGKCGEKMTGDRPGCVALNKTYHIDCFTCDGCQCKLSGTPFYAVDDKHYCERDYVETLDKCDTCQRPIKDKILKASGKAYHPACFVCKSCFRELDGIPFTVDSNNFNYCMQCFHDKFAPRCASCHKPIAPVEGQKETTRVVAMDRSYHVECYICEDCNLQLSSAIEGHGCYPLDNHLLCKNCNTARIRKLTADR